MTAVAIESLDQEGRGIARIDGKAVFVEGALPGERVDNRDPQAQAELRDRAQPRQSSRRARPASTPRCPHFGICGGCTLQHADPSLQVAAKQRVLEEALARIGRVQRGSIAAAGPRARVGLSLPRAAVGAPRGQERRRAGRASTSAARASSPTCSNATWCRRSFPRCSPPLRELIGAMTLRDRLPQIEVAVGEREGDDVYALVLRILGAAHGRRRSAAARLRRRARRRVLAADRVARRPCVPFHPRASVARVHDSRIRARRCRSRRPNSRR